jgi:hypothetical protein
MRRREFIFAPGLHRFEPRKKTHALARVTRALPRIWHLQRIG